MKSEVPHRLDIRDFKAIERLGFNASQQLKESAMDSRIRSKNARSAYVDLFREGRQLPSCFTGPSTQCVAVQIPDQNPSLRDSLTLRSQAV
jgi:hypothetical protein